MIPLAALGFAKRFGPWIVVAIVVAFAFGFGMKMLNDWKRAIHEEGRKEGVEQEAKRQQKVADQITKQLAEGFEKFGEERDRDRAEASEKETIHETRIEKTIQTVPDYSRCRVDDGVLGDRNAIRGNLETPRDPATPGELADATGKAS